MCKALCAAILLMTTMAAAQASQSSSPNTVVSPVIVAKGKFLNQTGAIPTTTILLPKQTGLFRLSIYGTVVALIQNGGTAQVNVRWTDDSGHQAIAPILNAPPNLGQFDTSLGGYYYYGYPMGGPVITFEAIAGQPITLDVNVYAPPNTYSLYYTLERLE